MGSWQVMMTTNKQKLISPEIHAKEWNFNTSKTAEAVTLLDLIATLRVKAMNANKGTVEVHVDNKDIYKE